MHALASLLMGSMHAAQFGVPGLVAASRVGMEASGSASGAGGRVVALRSALLSSGGAMAGTAIPWWGGSGKVGRAAVQGNSAWGFIVNREGRWGV